MRAQHHIRRAADGFDVWDVSRLVALARALLDGRTTVPARRFDAPVAPHRRGAAQHDLPL